jgi:hypothetical protein
MGDCSHCLSPVASSVAHSFGLPLPHLTQQVTLDHTSLLCLTQQYADWSISLCVNFPLIEIDLGDHPMYHVIALQCLLYVATHAICPATLSLSCISSQC